MGGNGLAREAAVMNILIRPGSTERRAAWVNIMQFYPNAYRPRPRHGRAAARWDEIPPAWTNPECGGRKEDYEMLEI
jgi:rubredoxin